MVCEADIVSEDVDELKKIIDSFLRKEKEYLSEINFLKEQIRCLQDKIFGRKSEKQPSDDKQPKQLSLFDPPEEEFPIAEQPEEDDEIVIPSHKRKKRGRKPIPENLPRIEVIHDIDDAEKLCECGCLKQCIGEEVSEQLDIVPAKINVIRNVRLKYACKNCEGVESDGPTVVIAPLPEQIIPKSIGTPGLMAFVMVAKFVDALPFYRQEKQFLRIGVRIPRATMCNWAQKIAESCEILLAILKKEVLSGPLIRIDETPVQVHNEPGKKNSSKSYMWVFRGGTRERPGIIFEYHATRGGDAAVAFLQGYTGVVQTDGYSGYDFLDNKTGISHMGCWAHARRKFMDVLKACGKGKDGKPRSGAAVQAMKYIRKIYEIEKDAHAKGLTGDGLLQERQAKTKPLLDEFKRWLDSKVDEVPPKSLLGKAIGYALNQWHRLVVLVETSHVTPDNNLAENSIRPFAVGRKNWLFSGTPEGATASAAMYTLIETAKANGLEPYWYLRFLFEKLPQAMTEEDFKVLLPQYVESSQLSGPSNVT